MGGRGWRIGRIGGVEVRVDSSWIVIAALIVYSRWIFFSDQFRFPSSGTWVALALAVMAAALFFGSVLAHELAHAAMSRLRHIEVVGITLWMFGGATEAKVESRGPADEFLIAVVGPATSLALGGLFRLVAPALPDGPAAVAFRDIGDINVLLAIFNVLPGFPLDGGRLLRSLLWRVTGSLARATLIAGRIGQAFGAALVATGLVLVSTQGDPNRLWLALIGWFLLQAATGAVADARRRTILSSNRVRDVMSAPPPSIPGDLPVSDAAARFLDGHASEAFPVMDDGHVVGFVSANTVSGLAPDRPVREAAVNPGTVLEAAPDESMDGLSGRLGERQTSAVLVVDDGRLVGVIEPKDIDRLFQRGRRRSR